jgi:hypothetical protein
MKKQTVKFLSILLVGVLALGVLTAFSPVGTVYADDTTPTAVPRNGVKGAGAQNGYPRLQDAYQREQKALSKQANHLTTANNAVGRVQDLISKGNSAGLDTSSLQSALSTFQSALSTAQTDHNNAAGVLSSHNGFDASGNVTDPTAALQTVTTAAQDMKDAASALKGAGSTLSTAVKNWVAANKGYYDGKLADAYKNLNNWLGIQQTNIGKLSDASGKLQDFINKAKANGEDTSSLEAVLADLNAKIPQSQGYHDQASSILGKHAGFDNSGNVTDEATARQTLQSAGDQLNNSEKINVALAQEVKNALQSWKSSHPTATPLPTSVVPTAQPTNG